MRTLLLAAAADAAAALLPSLALADEVRTGAAAYGDWHSDAPGVVRRITPADLPAPFATRNNAEPSNLRRRPTDMIPKAPPGFTVTLFASGLHEPRVLRTAPDGSVFLAESGAGQIRRFTPDGQNTVFAGDLDRPYGIAFWPPASPRFVYVANTDSIVRYAWRPGQATASGKPETIVPELPTGGHWTRDLAAAPDGSFIGVAIGSSGNLANLRGSPPGGAKAWQAAHGLGAAWGADTGRAVVLRMDPATGALSPYAQGLRNCSGLGVQPGNAAFWCVTNERDGMGDNLPPDYATHLTPGAFYGWPWFYIGDHPEPRLSGARADLADQVTLPDVLIQPHSAPLGIAFYTGTLFPTAYRGDAFVTLHGSWNRANRTGYKVIRIRMTDGHAAGSYEDFLTGFVIDDDAVWGRPVGITMAADGALLVSEDGSGTIWRVAPAR
jgi:glucose/arabinose dehydrogenase